MEGAFDHSKLRWYGTESHNSCTLPSYGITTDEICSLAIISDINYVVIAIWLYLPEIHRNINGGIGWSRALESFGND